MNAEYLLSIAIFCGIPIVIMLIYYKKELSIYRNVLIIMLILGIFFALFDYFAVTWGAWGYNASRTLGLKLITQFETFLFGAAVFLGVAMATIISAKMSDDYNRARKTKLKRVKKSQRQVNRLKP